MQHGIFGALPVIMIVRDKSTGDIIWYFPVRFI